MNGMFSMVTGIAGGVGIVLIGMVLMTDGLKALAGNSFGRILSRFTGTSLRAVASGTGITVIVQASSATILATIGFVGAGMLSFPAAIGVIFGANLGSTTTGWIVALMGLKFSISSITLPMICLGAMMKLLGKGRKANAGLAIAGFGLLFVGIDILQSGMREFSRFIDLSGFAADSFSDSLLLLAGGFIMTVLLQSSTVAFLAALAALGAGSISLEQSAIIVTGQNMGKSFYGVLGYIGASVSARRTALVHIFFNIFTGIIVFAVVGLFMDSVKAFCGLFGNCGPSILLCAFHTAFNLFGIVILLPFKSKISELMVFFVKDDVSMLIRQLDYSVVDVPSIAIKTVQASIDEIFLLMLQIIRDLTAADTPYHHLVKKLDAVDTGLREVKRFMSAVTSNPDSSSMHEQHRDIFHCIEHLERLSEACREVDNIRIAGHTDFLRSLTVNQLKQFDGIIEWLRGDRSESPEKSVEEVSSHFAKTRRAKREEIIGEISYGRIDPDSAFQLLEAMRWVDRIAYHIWRAISHVRG